MGHHFREQDTHVQNILPRRSILKGMLIGAAASMPMIAEAKVNLTNEEQLEICIDKLKSILAKMHPDTIETTYRYKRHTHGGYSFALDGYTPRIKWDGEGFYELYDGDHKTVMWVHQIYCHCDRRYGYRAYNSGDRRQVGPSVYFSEAELHLVRKIGDVA